MKTRSYKRFKSIAKLKELRHKLIDSLHGTFVLVKGETIESREERIKAQIKLIDERINELKCVE